MAASTISTVDFIMKKKYSEDKVGQHTKRDHFLLSKLNMKPGTIAGEDFSYVVRTGNPQGISGTFADAKSGASASNGKKFVTEPVLKYGFCTLGGPDIARAGGNKASFLNLVTMEMNGMMEEMGDTQAFDWYRNGDGNRGQRSSLATNTITLTNADDARNFKEDMVLIASANSDGSSPRTGTATVTAVDEEAGTVTVDSAAGISLFANSDYLFRKGDPGTCVDGLEALIPLDTPGATLFRNVARNTNTTRYAGYRIDNTSVRPEENLGLLAVKIHKGGKKSRVGICNPSTFWEISRRRDAKVEYDNGGGTAEFGFEYIVINTPGGALKLYCDPDCPTNREYVGSLEYLSCHHLGKYIHIIKDDGRTSRALADEDGIEVRWRSQSQSILTLPGAWGVASVA